MGGRNRMVVTAEVRRYVPLLLNISVMASAVHTSKTTSCSVLLFPESN